MLGYIGHIDNTFWKEIHILPFKPTNLLVMRQECVRMCGDV